MNMQKLLFKKVLCQAYLKKVFDGKFIWHVKAKDSENGRERYFYAGDSEDGRESSCEGCLDFLKTYYERKERKFSGFVVGTKKLVVNGYLVVDTEYDSYTGERTFIRKEPNLMQECAIVYFANNRKRFVPLEDLEVMEVQG